MENGTWVCFDCRDVVRRPTRQRGEVRCKSCGSPCHYLGSEVHVPSKRSVKAWAALQERYLKAALAIRDRKAVAKVRDRHELERYIAALEARAKADRPTQRIQALKQRLAELQ